MNMAFDLETTGTGGPDRRGGMAGRHPSWPELVARMVAAREASGALEFTTDNDQVIKGLDEAVQDMEVGEKRTVSIPAEKAYGPYSELNVQKRELRYIPNADQLPVGVP